MQRAFPHTYFLMGTDTQRCPAYLCQLSDTIDELPGIQVLTDIIYRELQNPVFFIIFL